jgi:AsmA protein
VGFGIPVAIVGPWASPQIYPDVAGILDNPDAAYAKLKEMGNGLFAPGNNTGDGSGNPSGGNSLGDTLGNLIQQGLNAARGNNTPPPPSPNSPSAPNPNDPPRQQDNQPLNNIMKQLFGR